jgi:hypothetical protein
MVQGLRFRGHGSSKLSDTCTFHLKPQTLHLSPWTFHPTLQNPQFHHTFLHRQIRSFDVII